MGDGAWVAGGVGVGDDGTAAERTDKGEGRDVTVERDLVIVNRGRRRANNMAEGELRAKVVAAVKVGVGCCIRNRWLCAMATRAWAKPPSPAWLQCSTTSYPGHFFSLIIKQGHYCPLRG
jgi:hypothetical protein